MKHCLVLSTAAILLVLAAIPDNPTRADVAEDWAQWELGTLGLTLELPGEPKMHRFPLSGPSLQTIEDYMGYYYGNEQMRVAILYFLVKRGTEKDLSRAPSIIAGAAVSGVTSNQGVSNLRYSVEQKGPKMVLTASFDYQGASRELDGVILVNGRRLWAVIGAHVQADENGHASTQRVLDSVRQKTK